VRLAWHRRQRQELRRKRCTARRIGGCDNHCDDNDEQHDRASHGHQSLLQEISWQDFWRSHAPRGASTTENR